MDGVEADKKRLQLDMMRVLKRALGLSALLMVGLGSANVPMAIAQGDGASAGQSGGQSMEAAVPLLESLRLERSSTNSSSAGDASSAGARVSETAVDDKASGVAATVLQEADTLATQAELLAQTAATAAEWDQVMVQWLNAIALAQSVPPESPSRLVAQRRLRRYLEQLLDAQQRAEQASPMAQLPSFGSDVFDAQLAGYVSYLATEGTPDVLIVGSSRALQGIDPAVLKAELARQGFDRLKVFNFSVNGATAQVVNFIVSELLPGELPNVIVWGDGSRAFNDGRRDRTWESLAASSGYRTVARGERPSALLASTASDDTGKATEAVLAATVTAHSPLGELPGALDDLGFSAVGDRFDPPSYYSQFSRVYGQYDGAYSPFSLGGAQTAALQNVSTVVAGQNSELIFVNLPLSDSYLDDFRMHHEGQFQQFLQVYGQAYDFEVVDLLTLWAGQPEFFADPSHINQYGAAAIAVELAQSPALRAALAQRSEATLQ